MARCYFCGGEVPIEGRVMRKDACPHCRRDLHACVQCRFHDPGRHNRCREPKAEMVAERERANQCDYFEWAGARAGGRGPDPGAARRRLEDLFKKG